ncbi:hypothetical protein M1P56_16895 [Streptomyces sp. HU2014]|uniref:hypothetical protein n=1 Tax=Streptomyces sp. HU2014 TaxID=2939414 RepID=UPI00200D2B8D|nr:hypothetical protein [Streptomyces sp. HU2014]UQI45914.1 hypothetical protein M1P56_16895 [Streptomyces sp. HU2014]
MGGVIGVAPAPHVHRRVDREPAQVCPHHLKLELQLITPVWILNGIEAENDGRPRLRAREDHMVQCPVPHCLVSVNAGRVNSMGRIFQGFHVSR